MGLLTVTYLVSQPEGIWDADAVDGCMLRSVRTGYTLEPLPWELVLLIARHGGPTGVPRPEENAHPPGPTKDSRHSPAVGRRGGPSHMREVLL